jgi:hypothetical protein
LEAGTLSLNISCIVSAGIGVKIPARAVEDCQYSKSRLVREEYRDDDEKEGRGEMGGRFGAKKWGNARRITTCIKIGLKFPAGGLEG